MRPVIARWLYPLAGVLLALSLFGIRRATHEVSHVPAVLPGGVPAVIYEPGPPQGYGRREPPPDERGFPVVVLAHGFAGTKGVMSVQARALARAGYAVIAFDFRGHGANRQPFEPGFAAPLGGLADDVDAAVLFARMHPRYDGLRIAVMGHSMGANAALNHASRKPDVAAVVLLSGGRTPLGPYPPPNVLAMWASGDPAGIREAGRALGAQLTGLERLVLDRTYGDPRRADAVRLVEVEGVNHWTLAYSAEASSEAIAWLNQAMPHDGLDAGTEGDGRLGWMLLGLVCFVVLLHGVARAVAPLVPHAPLPVLSDAPRRLGALGIALLLAAALLAGGDPYGSSEPARFLPLYGARDLLVFFALSGTALLVWLARRGEVSARGLAHAGTWGAAAAVLGFVYVALSGITLPIAEGSLASHRVLPAAAGFALSLPYFASLEFLLRGEGARGVWLPAVGKLLTLVALVGGALLGLLSFTVLLGTAAFAGLLILMEFTAWCLSRAAPNPWVPALVQAGWTAWALGAVFPLS